jgi:hypothetical protein
MNKSRKGIEFVCFLLDQPSTQTDPDEIWKGTDAKGHPVEIRWWKKMHVKKARWLEVTIIQVKRP